MNKKKIAIISVSIITIFVITVIAWSVFLKPCEHQWKDATCDKPVTCELCGETAGNSLGHSWKDATCVDAKSCPMCGAIEGEAIGHSWKDATCTETKTCSVCGATEGEALGHSWKDATYSAPKTCVVCGKTEGSALTMHDSGDNNIDGGQSEVSRCLICDNVTSRKETLYCSTHDCGQTNCTYPAKNVNSAWGSLCEFHSCRYPGCLSIPIGGTYYCGAHND